MPDQRPSTRPRGGRLRRAAAGVVLIAFGVGLAGLVFEVAVRLFVPVTDFFWQPDPVVGLRLIPDKQGRHIKAGVFDTPVRVNSAGFRDREHALEKPANTRRLVLLGDSFIEALQVPFEHSLTPLLETRLRTEGAPAEVINLGVSGFGTAREYLMLREYGARYRPDLVLLFFVGNDVTNNSRRLEGLPYLPYPVLTAEGTLARNAAGDPLFTPIRDTSSALGPLAAFLRHHSTAYRFLRVAIENAPALNEVLYRAGFMSTPPGVSAGSTSFGFYEIYRAQYQPAVAEAWATTEAFILETRKLAERQGSRFVLVIVPHMWEVYPEAWQAVLARVPAMGSVAMDLDKPSRRLSELCAAQRVACVNLLPAFRAESGQRPALFFKNDAHWTEAGNRLTAELLAKPIAAMLRSP